MKKIKHSKVEYDTLVSFLDFLEEKLGKNLYRAYYHEFEISTYGEAKTYDAEGNFIGKQGHEEEE